MNWKACSLSALAGVAIGWMLSKQVENRILPAEKALTRVKEQVKKSRHTIDGSWIHMAPETREINHMTYDVYTGGLTLTDGNEVKHYDFTADARTGTVLKLNKNE